MSLSKVPMPQPKKDTRPLEERLKDVKGLTLGRPTEEGYLFGNFEGKALTKAEAEDLVYVQITKDRPTYVSDIKCGEIPRADHQTTYKVTAVGYVPKPKPNLMKLGFVKR